MTQSGRLLSIQNLSKNFGQFQALSKLCLEINRGEFIALLGPSGCGKTTLLRILAGFETPNAGTVLLEGEDLLAKPAYLRPINTVFQQYALFPHLNVYENVCFGPRRLKWQEQKLKSRVQDALDLVQVAELAHRFPHQISGGQKQRVALARALVMQPKILLLDEPLAALDYQLRLQMQTELKLLQKKLGMTFIFVTHDQHEALALADRVAVLSAGKLVDLGTPEMIYQRPKSTFSASFIGASNFTEGEHHGIKGQWFLRPEWISMENHAPIEGISKKAKLEHVIYQGQ